jgi:mannose-6-phosphate isomerase
VPTSLSCAAGITESEACQQESIITVEHVDARLLSKSWGSHDLRLWSNLDPRTTAVGEIWFKRAVTDAQDPALLLKLLFGNEAPSIQVHPDDTCARSIGLAHGKTEAWYILLTTPGVKMAIGLKRRPTTQQLRTSIEDGSIADMVCWRQIQLGDVVFVPAGTIHAIGPGLVIAEIQL